MYVPCLTLLVFTSHCHLVPNGGMALGAFVTLFASRRLLTEFRKLIVAHEADNTIIAGEDFMERVRRHLGTRFHGFMIAQSHSAALRAQRFFLTFIARYHGLSILGCDMLSSMGMIMPSTSYDRMMKEVVANAKRTARFSQHGEGMVSKVIMILRFCWSLYS